MQPLRVIGMDAIGGHWIYLRQARVHLLPTFIGSQRLYLGPDFRVGIGHICQPVPEHLEVQHSAAYQQRDFADVAGSVNCSGCIPAEVRSAIGFGWIADVD